MGKNSKPAAKTIAVQRKQLSFWQTSFIAGSFIVVFAFLVFIPSITNGFIWDDDVMLTGNRLMTAPDGLQRIWFSTELSDYFPVTSTSFWIEWRLWGMNSLGYNVTNIFLHAVSGVLLWRVLVRLKVPGAWFAALLFTIHPVCVASVDWIAERKNTLSMFFYLSALLVFLRFEQTGRRRMYWLAFGLFLLALLSKTSVVVLPLVFLLCAWWQREEITKKDVLRSLPFFGLALVLGLVTIWFQLHEVLTGEAQESDTFLTRVLGGTWALWFYLVKDLAPYQLSFIYPQWDIDPEKLISYLPGLIWFIGLFALWWHRKTWGKPFLFGLGYFTIALLPVLGVIDMDFLLYSQVSDHLQYIAIPGAVALVVGIGATLSQRHLPNQWAPRLLAFIPVAILATLSWKQACIYETEEKLWRDTVKKNPTSWMAYHNLADTLAESRKFEEAISYYEQALRLKPDYAKTHNNLGNCLHLLGRMDEAAEQFFDAIQNKPEFAEAHHNLGVQLFYNGDYEAALEEYRKAITFKPEYAPAYFGAGNCAVQLNDAGSALNYFFSGLRYNPNSADAYYMIGLILRAQGHEEAAVRHFRNVLKINPRHEQALSELAVNSSQGNEG